MYFAVNYSSVCYLFHKLSDIRLLMIKLRDTTSPKSYSSWKVNVNPILINISWLTFQGLFALVIGVIVYFRAVLKKIPIFFPEFWFGKRNVLFRDFTWYYMHLFGRFCQFQNYHTNMKRLDITLSSLFVSEARSLGSWSFSVLVFQHYSVSKN